jgi:hypothetical protein
LAAFIKEPKMFKPSVHPVECAPRIQIDHRAMTSLLSRQRSVRLTVETDHHGETRAYLQRQAAQAVRK